MTTHLLPLPTHRPAGPVTTEEIELIARLASEARDLDHIVEETGRSRQTVVKYLRLMLPLAERGCPDPLVAERVGAQFAAGEFDWKATMALTPPPPPVTRIERNGLAGLANEELVTIALLVADRAGPRYREFIPGLCVEIRSRHLAHELHEARRRELIRAGLDPDQADRAASIWLEDHFDLHAGRSVYDSYRW